MKHPTDLAPPIVTSGADAGVIDLRVADASEGTTDPAPGANLMREGAVLAALMALLAFMWGRGRHVWFWIDEGISIGIASQPLATIPELLREDGAPPLYYFLLHGWMELFGSSESATHLLSLLFALATLPFALWAGWSLFGRRTGWVLVALVALNPYVAYYANETRMYSLVVLLSLSTTATFLHAFVFGRRRYLPAFVASLALLLYTHNWGLFFGVGLGTALAMMAVVADRPERKRVVVDAILGFGAVGLLYAPWIPTLLYQVTHSGAPWLLRPTLLLVREDVISLVGSEEAVVAVGFVATVALIGILRWPWDRLATAVAASMAILLVTVGVAWLVSRQNAVWTHRYLAVLVAPLLVILAVGLARGGRLAMAGLVVYALLAAPVDVKGQPYDKSNMKEIAEEVSPLLAPGDLVIASFGRVPLLSHYLPPGLRYAETTGPVTDPRLSDQRDAVERLNDDPPETALPPLLSAVAAGEHVLVVCPPPAMLRPDDTVFVELISSHCRDALALLTADPNFRLDAAVLADPTDLPMAPEDGYLFTKMTLAAPNSVP